MTARRWWLLLAGIAGIEAAGLYGVWWLGHQNISAA